MVRDQEANDANRENHAAPPPLPKDHSKLLALIYMLVVYSLGLLFALLPTIYMSYYRGMSERETIQAKSLANGYKLICGL